MNKILNWLPNWLGLSWLWIAMIVGSTVTIGFGVSSLCTEQPAPIAESQPVQSGQITLTPDQEHLLRGVVGELREMNSLTSSRY
jgi:hypothetical protein